MYFCTGEGHTFPVHVLCLCVMCCHAPMANDAEVIFTTGLLKSSHLSHSRHIFAVQAERVDDGYFLIHVYH